MFGVSEQITKLLLAAKANPNHKNHALATPLHLGAYMGYSRVVQHLVVSGAQAEVLERDAKVSKECVKSIIAWDADQPKATVLAALYVKTSGMMRLLILSNRAVIASGVVALLKDLEAAREKKTAEKRDRKEAKEKKKADSKKGGLEKKKADNTEMKKDGEEKNNLKEIITLGGTKGRKGITW